MPEYVFWYSDLWGWDSSPGAVTADIHREMEIGFLAMAIERMENTNPVAFFLDLELELTSIERWRSAKLK